MTSTEEKLDTLLRSVAALMENQATNQRKLDAKLKKLEKDIAAAQEDATEHALKKAKRDRPIEFKQKGHQEQYEFNEGVKDRLEAATKKIERLVPGVLDGDTKKFRRLWMSSKKVSMLLLKGKSTSSSWINPNITGGWWRRTRPEG